MKSFFGFNLLFFLALSTFALPQVNRIIVFGDSLSDMGTYSKMAGPLGGGKFTTNPGKLWIEHIADRLHLPLKVNRYEGFGTPPQILGGNNYAQGGSRILSEKRNQNNRGGFTARSLVTQVNYFVQAQKNFKSDDVVFILGGANDLIAYFNEYASGRWTQTQALQKSEAAARDLIALIKNIRANGEPTIVVLNLPAIDETPLALDHNDKKREVLKSMIDRFNSTLWQQKDVGLFRLVDFNAFDRHFNQNYQQYGFKNVTGFACNLKALAMASSILCNSKTLVEANADKTYKFADKLHPTTGYSAVAADYIWNQIQN